MPAFGITRVLALPLLVLLHLLFSLFSLLLRITQSVTKSGTPVQQVMVPYHIALCLPAKLSRKGLQRPVATEFKERQALVESIRRAVKWAGEDGVRELSVYSNLGQLIRLRFDSV